MASFMKFISLKYIGLLLSAVILMLSAGCRQVEVNDTVKPVKLSLNQLDQRRAQQLMFSMIDTHYGSTNPLQSRNMRALRTDRQADFLLRDGSGVVYVGGQKQGRVPSYAVALVKLRQAPVVRAGFRTVVSKREHSSSRSENYWLAFENVALCIGRIDGAPPRSARAFLTPKSLTWRQTRNGFPDRSCIGELYKDDRFAGGGLSFKSKEEMTRFTSVLLAAFPNIKLR